VFEGEPFQRQKGRIVERFTVREKELMGRFHAPDRARTICAGPHAGGRGGAAGNFPVLEGQMVPIEDISKMVHEGKLESPVAEDIERKYEQFRQEFTVVYRKTLNALAGAGQRVELLGARSGLGAGRWRHRRTQEKYLGPNIAEYLEEVRHHLLDNLDPFKEREGEGEHDEETPDGLPKAQGGPERDPFRVLRRERHSRA